MQKYPWAVNPLKLQRAITKAGVGAEEQVIKDLYVSYGGLLNVEYHDTTIDTEIDTALEESQPAPRRQVRTRVSRTG